MGATDTSLSWATDATVDNVTADEFTLVSVVENQQLVTTDFITI